MNDKDLLKIQTYLNRFLKEDKEIEFFHGFLSAVICAPQIIEDEEWLTFFFDEEPEFKSEEEEEEFYQILFDLFDNIIESIENEKYAPLYSLDKKKITPEIAKTWAKGFFFGLDMWEDFETSDEDEDYVNMCLIPVSMIFNPKEFFEELSKHDDKLSDEEKNEALDSAVADIKDAVTGLYNFFNYEGEEGDDCCCGEDHDHEDCQCDDHENCKDHDCK
jgi:yecA family protein